MCRGASPALRSEMAILAIDLLVAKLKDFGSAFNLVQDVVTQLPVITSLSSDVTDIQYLLSKQSGHMAARISRLGGLAASLDLLVGETAFRAIKLLDGSRGIISGQVLDLRANLFGIGGGHGLLAIKYNMQSVLLESVPRGYASSTSFAEVKRRVADETKFNELLAEMRTQERFHGFLEPPTEKELMAITEHGSIVLLSSSELQSNAFIIDKTRIRSIELPDISDDRVRELGKEFRLYGSDSSTANDIAPLLKEMWLHVAKPVLDELGFCNAVTDLNWPRVWWVLTGSFTNLLLHAAGIHQLDSSEAVIDRVVSSYAPTVKALVHEYRKKPTTGRPWKRRIVTLVGMPETPDARPLPAVKRDVDDLRRIWYSDRLRLLPVVPPTKSKVLSALASCDIFHFAGHGRTHPADPSRSELLLQDYEQDPLTVRDLRDVPRRRPFLAYLSACVTSVNDADDLVDEGIHISSALQLSGIRHVIGTMWEVSDSHSVDVATEYYRKLLPRGKTDEAIAMSLHESIRSLRQSYITSARPSQKSSEIVPQRPQRAQNELVYPERSTATSNRDELNGKALTTGDSEATHSHVTSHGPSRGERGAGGVMAGPAKRPAISRMYWIPYMHFGP